MRRWLVIGACIAMFIGLGPGGAVATTPEPPATVATSENVFLPEDARLTECVGALQRPECGSDAKGGWRQALVLLVIAAGVALITWRVVRATRRRRTS